MKNIILIGTGLIGGSFLLELRAIFDEAQFMGIDHNSDHINEAIRLGIIDREAGPEELTQADLIIIAIPVSVIPKVLVDALDRAADDCLIIDMGSTKEQMCQVVADHPKRRNYLACHPIAGTEFSGPPAAHLGLFNGKTMIVCEVEKTAFSLQEKAMQIFKDIGMRIRYMAPRAHDKHIAYVSHLSHISSFMLGKTVIEKEKDERDIFDLAGSGFESTVRLAKSSPEMWAAIFLDNKANILETLEAYIKNLSIFKELIEGGDLEGLHQSMDKTNHIKQILKGISR